MSVEKVDASEGATCSCPKTWTSQLMGDFARDQSHIDLLGVRGREIISREGVLGLTKAVLVERMALFFFLWFDLLEKGTREVVSTIYHVNEETGAIVENPVMLMPEEKEKIIRYVKLPDPYAYPDQYDGPQVMFSVVGEEYGGSGGSGGGGGGGGGASAGKVKTREHLGFYPIHGPWAEIFRPRVTQGVVSSNRLVGSTDWWHPVADLFGLPDFIPHIKASFVDMIELLFCYKNEQSFQSDEDKEQSFICALPLHIKRCVEFDLAAIMTTASVERNHKHLVVPVLPHIDSLEGDDNGGDDPSSEGGNVEDSVPPNSSSKSPLADRKGTERYLSSPAYIPFDIPYDTPFSCDISTTPPKQTPSSYCTEIEDRVIRLHHAYTHMKIKSILGTGTTMTQPVSIEFDSNTLYRTVPSQLFTLFDRYFGKEKDEDLSMKMRSIDGTSETTVDTSSASLKRKKCGPWDSKEYIDYIHGERRQIVTGAYIDPFPEVARYDFRRPLCDTPVACLVKTDSMPHDFVVDYFSYTLLLYLSPDKDSTSQFLTQLILYRIQNQMNIWMGDATGNPLTEARNVPDVASIARFRAHHLLLNNHFWRYANLYWQNFTKRPIDMEDATAPLVGSDDSKNADSPTHHTPGGTLADVYTDSFMEILKEYQYLHDDEQWTVVEKCEMRCVKAREFFTLKNYYKVPPCVTMNFNFFITTIVRHFTNEMLPKIVERLSNTELNFYEDGKPPTTSYHIPPIHSMASKIALRLEPLAFEAHKKRVCTGLV